MRTTFRLLSVCLSAALMPWTLSASTTAFDYAGSTANFTVPAGVTSLHLKLWAAGGGGNRSTKGGSGVFMTGDLDVTPGELLTIIVGGGGAIHSIAGGTTVGGVGGFGGGGSGGNGASKGGSGGGGASSILRGNTILAVAAAGGGAGGSDTADLGNGGSGGASSGYSGTGLGPGTGGTLSSGGAGGSNGAGSVAGVAGSSRAGGNGGTKTTGIGDGGGGGGGGYFGGGGGQGYDDGSGGGGGSSFAGGLASNSIAVSSNEVPSGTGDPDYVAGIAMGGTSGTNGVSGGNGRIVIDATQTDFSSPVVSAPVAGFTPLNIVTGLNGTVALPDYATQASASDNVAVVGAITQSPSVGSGQSVGTTHVVVSATDAAGNVGTLSFDVTVSDGTPPAITSTPANRSLAADANGKAVLPDLIPEFAATDNVAVVSKTQSPAAGTLLSVGNNDITMSALDAAANTGTATVHVTVVDETQPVVSAPAAGFSQLIIATGVNGKAAVPNYAAQASAADNVGVSGALSQSPVAGSEVSVGTVHVTLTAVDAAGNAGQLAFDVTVSDGTAPAFLTIPANVSVEATSAAGATVSYPAATVSDLITASPTLLYSQNSGTTFPLGVTVVTISATDAASNTGTATFTVTVSAHDVDHNAPVVKITAPNTSAVTGAFIVSGTVRENIALKSLTVKFNGVPLVLDALPGSAVNSDVPWQASGVSPENGVNTIVVEAIDFADRKGIATKRVTFTNQRPELAGTYLAVLAPNSAPTLDNMGLVTVTVSATGAFTGKITVSKVTLAFTGVLRNDGGTRFTPTLGPVLTLVDRAHANRVLGTLAFSVDDSKGLNGTFDVADSPDAAVFSSQRTCSLANPVPAGLLNLPVGLVPAKGVYNVVFPSQAQSPPFETAKYPQGNGYAKLTLTRPGMLTLSGWLADGTKYVASSKLRIDGTAALFTQLYTKLGFVSGELAFADLADTDVSGPGFTWLRPVLPLARIYTFGWPGGIQVSAVGTKYAGPSSLEFGQGAADPVNGNAILTFTEGLIGSPVTQPVSVDPGTGLVKPVPLVNAPYKLTVSPASGLFSGTFRHGGVEDNFHGILLNKGANQGGSGYFVTRPSLTTGAAGQSGGVSLAP